MRYVFLCVLPIAGLSLGAPGCSQPVQPASKVAVTVAPSSGSGAMPANAQQLGHFTASYNAKTNKMSFAPVGDPIVLDDNLHPESQNPITVSQSGGGTAQPKNTVDLVSTNCVNTYVPGSVSAGTFQCDVEMRSYYNARALPNVYVQIDKATISGTTTSAYDSIDSDTDSTYSPPIATDHGLWAYQNGAPSGPFLSANDGSNGGNGNGLNTATRTWEFANPGNANVDYDILVWASLGFSSYTFGFPVSSYTPVCPAAGGTGTPEGIVSKTNVTVPFDFTIYNTNTTRINLGRNGQITFCATTLDASGTSLALPSKTPPKPVFFPFWDNLVEGGNPTAQMCTQTIGTAPNRQFVIEWYNFDFGNAPDGPGLGANLDFEVFLDEGTYEIDTVYNTMNPATGVTDGRESGKLATVGMQDETGTISTSEHDQNLGDSFGSGQGYSYTGNP